jgi:hypothetical protein
MTIGGATIAWRPIAQVDVGMAIRTVSETHCCRRDSVYMIKNLGADF